MKYNFERRLGFVEKKLESDEFDEVFEHLQEYLEIKREQKNL